MYPSVIFPIDINRGITRKGFHLVKFTVEGGTVNCSFFDSTFISTRTRRKKKEEEEGERRRRKNESDEERRDKTEEEAFLR